MLGFYYIGIMEKFKEIIEHVSQFCSTHCEFWYDYNEAGKHLQVFIKDNHKIFDLWYSSDVYIQFTYYRYSSRKEYKRSYYLCYNPCTAVTTKDEINLSMDSLDKFFNDTYKFIAEHNRKNKELENKEELKKIEEDFV